MLHSLAELSSQPLPLLPREAPSSLLLGVLPSPQGKSTSLSKVSPESQEPLIQLVQAFVRHVQRWGHLPAAATLCTSLHGRPGELRGTAGRWPVWAEQLVTLPRMRRNSATTPALFL